MVHATVPVGRLLAALLALSPAYLTGGVARADGNASRGNVLQSGHVGTDWRRASSFGGGLSLTFKEEDAVHDEARREMRHHLKDIVDTLPLPHVSLLPESSSGLPGDTDAEALLGFLGEDITVARTGFGWELDARPFARLKADLDEAEARTGIRIRWGRGLSAPAEDGHLRAYLYADWEARAGVEDFLGGTHGTGGHDLDSGMALSLGGWSLAFEANLAGSGFSHHEEDGAAGYLGYAIRF